MYGFCRITDLGISHFNFSSKTYSSKVYTCFEKVLVLVTHSTTKLGLQFLDFFCNFKRFFKVTAKTHKRGEIHFANRPLESFGCSQLCPWFTITPLERSQSNQCSPGARGRHGRPDSGEVAGGLGRGSSWRGSRGHKGAICVLTRDGERAGGRARRRPAAAAAGVITPASRRLGMANKRGWDLCWRKGGGQEQHVSVLQASGGWSSP
jgi:hypothetical protein